MGGEGALLPVAFLARGVAGGEGGLSSSTSVTFLRLAAAELARVEARLELRVAAGASCSFSLSCEAAFRLPIFSFPFTFSVLLGKIISH